MPATLSISLYSAAATSVFWHSVSPVVVILGSACFFSFVWAIRSHFRQPGGMPAGMHLVSLLSVVGFLWFILESFSLRPVGDWDAYAGDLAIVLFLLSLVIFWWSIRVTRIQPLTLAFASDVPAFLQHRGPYNYVRHPFYLSYLLFWIGTAIAVRHRLYWVVPAVMGALYIVAARREERKFDASTLATAYRAYRQRTGMLVPRLRRQSDGAR